MTDLESKFVIANIENDLKTVKECIKQGVDVNTKILFGSTSLIWNSYRGHLDIVKLLINKGADINVKNEEGNTALKESFYFGNSKIKCFLIPLIHEYEQFEDIYNNLNLEQKHIMFKHFIKNKELLKQVNPMKMKGFTKDINEYIKQDGK